VPRSAADAPPPPLRAARRRTAAVPIVLFVVAVLTLAGCARVIDGHPRLGNAPDATLRVIGDSHGPFDTTVKNALSDIEAFWRRNYPAISGGKPLPALKGGLFSVDGARVARTGRAYAPVDREACIHSHPNFIVDNAAYCLQDDSIVWDRAPQHLFGKLAQHYGRLMIALVFAHEFGHAISARLGIFATNPKTIDTESQADCAAGAWAASLLQHQDPHFRSVTSRDIDDALEGYLNGRDKTVGPIPELSHGNGFDRLSAVADGLDHGVTYCYSKNYFDRTFTERPYSTSSDYAAGGNEPLSLASKPNNFLAKDLNRFFTHAATAEGTSFAPVSLKPTAQPQCPDSAAAQLLYCPTGNAVQFTPQFAKTAYYSLPDVEIEPSTGNAILLFNQPADFALGEMYAMAWGLAVRHQLHGASLDDRQAITAAVCYTGAYAKNVNVASDPSGTKLLMLSPADLDEALSALLDRQLQEQSFGEHGTTGLDRVQAFVKGYAGGLASC
jgi:predicted metalloprotease